LTGLADLAVFGNRLEKLPSNIGRLTALQALRCQSNQLKEVCCVLCVCVGVQTTRFNSIRCQLPSSIAMLTRLSVLDLGRNRLTAAPAWLGSLTNLGSLSLFANRISTTAPLPSTLGQFRGLVIQSCCWCSECCWLTIFIYCRFCVCV
jgi:Leucine-rich repeat (LRR) protein